MRSLPLLFLLAILCAGCTRSSAEEGYSLSFSPSLQECQAFYTKISTETDQLNHCVVDDDCKKTKFDRCGQLINTDEKPSASLASAWQQYADVCQEPGAYTCAKGSIVCMQGKCVQQYK